MADEPEDMPNDPPSQADLERKYTWEKGDITILKPGVGEPLLSREELDEWLTEQKGPPGRGATPTREDGSVPADDTEKGEAEAEPEAETEDKLPPTRPYRDTLQPTRPYRR